MIKNTPAWRRCGFHPWVPWRKKWQPTPVFLPGKSHGQRSLAGYSLRGHKKNEHNLTTKQQLNNKRELNLRSILSAQLKCTLMLTIGSVLKNKSVELIHLTLTETLCMLIKKSMFPSPLSPWKPAFQYLTL